MKEEWGSQREPSRGDHNYTYTLSGSTLPPVAVRSSLVQLTALARQAPHHVILWRSTINDWPG